jgi:tetratricopeptide (TPR) repeat protein
MSIATHLAALALTLTGAVGAMDAEAAGLELQTTPEFVQRAEVALANGNTERAVGLIAPRIDRLRGEYARSRAYGTLCNAHLRQKDFDLAGEACRLAAGNRYATWSDFNNLGAWYYLTGDLEAAREQFEKAAELAPGREAVAMNIEATLAASGR